jgi:hypothetical protein
MSPLRVLTLVASGLLLAAPALSADPPAATPSAAPASSVPRRPLEAPRERVLERLRERGLALPSASALPPLPSLSGAPFGGAGPAPSNAPAIAEELGRKWRALTATRLERRERHRAALVRELGQRLSDPLVKAELQLHATRIAELSRIRFLAENARRGAERERLLSRVDKLVARENERHRKRIALLSGATAAASGSASAGAPAAPSPRPSTEAPR